MDDLEFVKSTGMGEVHVNSIYQIEVQPSNGEARKLNDHQGDVLLIVNVASACGFTTQYE